MTQLHPPGEPTRHIYQHEGGGAIMPLIVWPLPTGELEVSTMALRSANIATYWTRTIDPSQLQPLIEAFANNPEQVLAEFFGRTYAKAPTKPKISISLEELLA